MSVLDELSYYCKAPKHVGAVLITGEWGCGKTYFVEHTLKNALKDECIILRVSLFGLSSTEELHQAVKTAWINETEDVSITSGMVKLDSFFKPIKDSLKESEVLPGVFNAFLNFDSSKFIKVKNEINNKRVVLVFDDLERNKMDVDIVLGIINDYCENKEFPTIIVANENKISDESDEEQMSYKRIKEKIIQKTLKYTPEFDDLINNLIEELKPDTKDIQYSLRMKYYDFFKENSRNLVTFFSMTRVVEDNDNKKTFETHNIRNIKCSFLEYYRIFKILIENEIDKEAIYQWLVTFISFSFVNKSGIFNDLSAYGFLFWDNNVHTIFPEINTYFITDNIKKWIIDGIWDEKSIEQSIIHSIESRKELKPLDLIKNKSIICISDEILDSEFENLMDEAYSGVLNLSQYIKLLENIVFSRINEIRLPVEVDFEKLISAIDLKIKNVNSEEYKYLCFYSSLPEKIEKNLEGNEVKIYDMLHNPEIQKKLDKNENKKKYMEIFNSFKIENIPELQLNTIKLFDNEMAEITLNFFIKLDNEEKTKFTEYWYNAFSQSLNTKEIKTIEDYNGLYSLKVKIEEENKKDEYTDKSILKLHNKFFNQYVDILIDILTNQKENIGAK